MLYDYVWNCYLLGPSKYTSSKEKVIKYFLKPAFSAWVNNPGLANKWQNFRTYFEIYYFLRLYESHKP